MSTRRRRRPSRAWPLWAAALALHCGSDEPAGPPEVAPELAAAISLLDSARHSPLGPEDLAGCVARQPLARGDAALLEALSALEGAGELRVSNPLVMTEVGKAGLEIEVELATGATALYRAQTARDPGGDWLVVWLAGPGVEWPPRPAPRESLSVSAPP